MSSEAHHARLLLAVLRERWDEVDAVVDREPPDPDRFLAICNACDVVGWLHALLERRGRSGQLGEEIAERLGLRRAKVRQDNLILFAHAEAALDLLLGRGIKPLALKGFDLIHRVYERFDERSLDDVDLLVRPEQLAEAVSALEAGGWTAPPEPQRTHYIRSSHHLPLRSPGPVSVECEIHWNLAQETRFRVDGDGLFARALPLEVAGRAILRMHDHDLAAHLLLHHITHYFDRRAKWAIDLCRLGELDGFDWELVAERLQAWHAGASAGISLRHLKKLFPEWIPDRALELLPVAAWRRALSAPLRSRHPLELFRGTHKRWIRLYLASVFFESPAALPGWLVHKLVRDRRAGANPLDSGGSGAA